MRGTELTEREQLLGNAAAGKLSGEAIEGGQRVQKDKRLQFTVQRADGIYTVRGTLLFCLHALHKFLGPCSDIVDFLRAIFENRVAQLLSLPDRSQLRR